MKVIIASKGGFCFGVERAYELIKKNIDSYPKPVRILGSLVHNNAVIKEIESWGVKKVVKISHRQKGTLIIPAHGLAPQTIREIISQNKELKIVNTTCPKVSQTIAKAQKLQTQGRLVLIFGDKEHVEVKAINGALSQKGFIFSNLNELDKLVAKIKQKHKKPLLGLVCQTTQNISLFEQAKTKLKTNFKNLKVYNTICAATYERQREAFKIAQKVDAIIVVGSKISANSQRLYEICLKANSKCYFTDNAAHIKKSWLKGVNKVGICAGASTPETMIKEVMKKINA